MTKHQQAGKYFVTFPASQDPIVANFVFSEMMPAVARATAGIDRAAGFDENRPAS